MTLGGYKVRILIVEDEKEIADGIQRILEEEGYQTDVTYDGLNGLDYILSGIYDLVLLDVMLPKINGFDILKNIRREGFSVPVIMLTAKSQTEDKVAGFDEGADDYLTKPFDAMELLARIRARLRGGNTSTGRELVFSDMRLSPATYKLFGKDKSVKLSQKEFFLLEYLMTNPGQILTKDMILTKVWGFDSEPDYNNLEVYISFVRKKMRFVETKAQIITTKGVGYSIEAEDGT